MRCARASRRRTANGSGGRRPDPRRPFSSGTRNASAAAELSGFYDGVKFHRVIPGFVVQGGDPLSRDLPTGDRRIGTGGPGYKIKCETAGNPHRHERGALSMAHAGKDTGGSQFFIVLNEESTKHLNGVHTVFGKITAGTELITKLQKNDV